MTERLSVDAAVRLEEVFSGIAATRMADLPILNPALGVAAVGFRAWRGGSCGILITPWFMNLILLPGPPSLGRDDLHAEIGDLPSGTRLTIALPSGDYDFLAAREDSLGPYLSCSLFSPMSQFVDMDGARAVAAAAILQLFAEPPAAAQVPADLSGRLAQPVSRRGFLAALLPGPLSHPDKPSS